MPGLNPYPLLTCGKESLRHYTKPKCLPTNFQLESQMQYILYLKKSRISQMKYKVYLDIISPPLNWWGWVGVEPPHVALELHPPPWPLFSSLGGGSVLIWTVFSLSLSLSLSLPLCDCCWDFCCCLNRERLKNRPKIAFKLPSFISKKKQKHTEADERDWPEQMICLLVLNSPYLPAYQALHIWLN